MDRMPQTISEAAIVYGVAGSVALVIAYVVGLEARKLWRRALLWALSDD